ncbi:hypothetical protein AXK56_16545 [Tsukamurella pulmonis]|uniref:XamI restriction endonuclease n=1 Tax=Tsukamurella pulmonis TaxID=47312 RepID=A0A1H1AA20_9ACTN|nr:hypothetical protein [Tsukamurella pulmonis]KXO95819.1 hypothetical protein AXK56_16545 [Tsukamurella pulmonis]SDQ36361.1 hypothetical protein SAMN04489765_0119 [Tsukamurella pulmonis]SUQ39418.1 Uncharacterised protein [Tsukamurella pulmonis]
MSDDAVKATVAEIALAATWEERIKRIRLVPQKHGIAEHAEIYATVARVLYVPNLAPDFAYIHGDDFYDLPYFQQTYDAAIAATNGFTAVTEADLARIIQADPRTLLPLRTIMGFTKTEFAHSTTLVAGPLGLAPLSAAKVDSMERKGSTTNAAQAQVAAKTLVQVLNGALFGAPPAGVRSKQDKPDTAQGWATVQQFAQRGVPFATFLHQRHYGGAFRQVLDATSTRRGDMIEDAVEDLFNAHGVDFIRTGSTNQGEIAERFEIHVAPAPDFVVFKKQGGTEVVRAMLECKTINDGGTARDKAPRFKNLRDECTRLGGIPLIGVLGGMAWTRVNDTLGPVIRDTDGRVFSLSNLDEMLSVSPFPDLVTR